MHDIDQRLMTVWTDNDNVIVIVMVVPAAEHGNQDRVPAPVPSGSGGASLTVAMLGDSLYELAELWAQSAFEQSSSEGAAEAEEHDPDCSFSPEVICTFLESLLECRPRASYPC